MKELFTTTDSDGEGEATLFSDGSMFIKPANRVTLVLDEPQTRALYEAMKEHYEPKA